MDAPPALERALRPTPPFSFDLTLRVLEGFHASPAGRIVDRAAGRLVTALRAGGPGSRPVLVEAVATGSVERPGLALRISGGADREPVDDAEADAAAGRLAWHVGAADDLAPLYRVAEGDPAFARVRERLHGLHLPRHPTPFEAVAWAVVRQRTPNPFAQRTMAGLCDALGDGLEPAAGGPRLRAFPDAAALAPGAPGAREAVLAVTNNTRKTDRLVPLAGRFAGFAEEALRTDPWDEVAARLRSLPGVGAWSVDYVMVQGLGRGERAPWTDTGLIEAISGAYTRGFAISRGDARELAERYGWTQGWWARYLKLDRRLGRA